MSFYVLKTISPEDRNKMLCISNWHVTIKITNCMPSCPCCSLSVSVFFQILSPLKLSICFLYFDSKKRNTWLKNIYCISHQMSWYFNPNQKWEIFPFMLFCISLFLITCRDLCLVFDALFYHYVLYHIAELVQIQFKH